VSKQLPARAQVVVIGGGVIGTSVAYHLTRLGWTDVVLLEQGRLSLDQLADLVTSYYGRERPSKIARAQVFGLVGQYGWTLWGAIQHAVSPIDFDFWGWAMERYDIAAAGLRSPDLDRLLTAVQTPD
jgi:choline dehydrogenase-like flavoprotein